MTYFVKNTSNDTIIEPYFGVTLPAGETGQFEQNVAQRLLVLRPADCKLVDAPEPEKPKTSKKETKE